MDNATEWLRYLELRLSGAQADLRVRSTVTIPSAVVLIIGSIVFIHGGDSLIMGLIGIVVALVVLGSSTVYNLKSFVFISGCDIVIRKILLGELKEPTEINKAVNEVIDRYAAKSAINEGLEIVKGTAERRS